MATELNVHPVSDTNFSNDPPPVQFVSDGNEIVMVFSDDQRRVSFLRKDLSQVMRLSRT